MQYKNNIYVVSCIDLLRCAGEKIKKTLNFKTMREDNYREEQIQDKLERSVL